MYNDVPKNTTHAGFKYVTLTTDFQLGPRTYILVITVTKTPTKIAATLCHRRWKDYRSW